MNKVDYKVLVAYGDGYSSTYLQRFL